MSTKPLFKRITQVALVVRSVDETVKKCTEDFGMGPWTFCTFDPSNVAEMRVRGKRVDHAIRTAHTNIGGIDWELIEPLDERSMYAEHLRTHGEGLHHVLFGVDDYAAAVREMGNKGFEELTSGDWEKGAYSYFDTRRSLGCIAEFFAS